MARLFGVNIPDNEKLGYALTKLYGIGWAKAGDILKVTGIDGKRPMGQLKEDELKKIVDAVEKKYKIEGDLREEEADNIKRLKDIGTLRGFRHIKGLPVRGQRTKSNARTKRGKRRTVGSLTKEAWAKMETTQQQAKTTT